MPVCLITGATGFVGGHLAEACVKRGWSTRALARSTAQTEWLEKLGVQIVRGDLGDLSATNSLAPATSGVEIVFHCAAKVGDWGPVEDYRAVNVEGLGAFLQACEANKVQRFVHVSSLGVYAARHHHGTDETEPLPSQHMDGYTQTKVESEQLVLDEARLHGLPAVVVRPGFIYGPRDRTVLPRLIEALRGRRLRYIGSRQRAMNTIYVGNLVDALFLAASHPEAVRQVYNVTDGEMVSKRRFLETLADGMGLPRPRPVPVPLFIARPLARWLEARAKRVGAAEAPFLTQATVKFLGLNLDFSIERARRELGYQPATSFEEGMRATVAWYKQNSP